MSRPRRKDIEIEHTRRHITDAAARVFARKGYAGATIHDIAAEADYSAPSLYSYFKGKRAIFDALLERLREEFGDCCRIALPAGLTLAQKVELLLQSLTDWARGNAEAFAFLNRREGMMLKAETMVNGMPGMVAHFVAWFEEHTTTDERSGHTAQTAGWLLWSLAYGLNCRTTVAAPEGDAFVAAPEAIQARQLASFFLHAIRAPVEEVGE